MIELSQCPNCAETDKVTIAGKVFCAKCGTATDQPTPATTDTTQAMVQPDAPATPVQNSDFPSVQKFQAAPPATQAPLVTDSAAAEAPLSPAAETPAQPTLEAQTQAPVSQPALESQPSPEPQQVTAPAQDTQKLDEQINSLSQSVPVAAQAATQPESKVAPSTAEPVAPLAGLAASTQAPIAPAPPPTAPATPVGNTAGSLTDIKPVSRVPEHVGSEIMSLDKKDNAVFSDDQLNELAKITTENPKPNAVTVPDVAHTPTTAVADQEPVISPMAKAPISASTQDIKPPATPPADTAPTLDKVVENSSDKTKDEPKSSFSQKSKKGLKPASIALTIVALFLVGAYIWQVNYPSLAFKIASAKAGVSASLPGYVPSGWKMLGDISTNPGTVSYALSSPDNSKKISITQTKTDWDSQALAENYVAPKAENYLALQAQGLTIYVYGHNQASWVNKGTWYKIETTDQSLTQDQIIKIATSL